MLTRHRNGYSSAKYICFWDEERKEDGKRKKREKKANENKEVKNVKQKKKQKDELMAEIVENGSYKKTVTECKMENGSVRAER